MHLTWLNISDCFQDKPKVARQLKAHLEIEKSVGNAETHIPVVSLQTPTEETSA